MDISQLILTASVCITAAALCRIFDSSGKEYGVMLKTAAAAGIMIAVINAVMPVFGRIEEIFMRSGADSYYYTVLVKSAGVCCLTKLAFDICTDSGETALAAQADMTGKITLLVIAMPLFEEAVDMASKFIG